MQIHSIHGTVLQIKSTKSTVRVTVAQSTKPHKGKGVKQTEKQKSKALMQKMLVLLIPKYSTKKMQEESGPLVVNKPILFKVR